MHTRQVAPNPRSLFPFLSFPFSFQRQLDQTDWVNDWARIRSDSETNVHANRRFSMMDHPSITQSLFVLRYRWSKGWLRGYHRCWLFHPIHDMWHSLKIKQDNSSANHTISIHSSSSRQHTALYLMSEHIGLTASVASSILQKQTIRQLIQQESTQIGSAQRLYNALQLYPQLINKTANQEQIFQCAETIMRMVRWERWYS